MTFLLVLLLSIVFVIALKKPIEKHPVLFFMIAFVLDVLFVCNSYVAFPRVVASVLFMLIQKCTLSLALFVIVMYIGVFSRGSRVRTYLLPIRAELSIIAWILSLGHMAVYLASFAPQVSHGAYRMDASVLGSLSVAFMLLVLLLVLGVTSFAPIKRNMRFRTWKRIQILAYPFFFFVYIHLLLMLLPAALRGGVVAQERVAVYSVVFVGYFVLRIYRAACDRSNARKQKDGFAVF